MGFFSRLFKKENKDEPVYPVETVGLSILSDWFLKRTKSRFKDMEKDLSISFQYLRKQSEDIKTYLKNLKEAELMNPDIPEKERQVMEGNRSSYLQQTAIFLSQMNIPDDINYRTALDFTQDFKESLKTLAKSTAKNTQVLRYFFEKELVEVNQRLKRMNDEVEKMHTLLNDEERGVTYVDQTQDRIDAFIAKCKHRKELLSKMEDEQIKLENSKSMKAKFSKEVDDIKSRQEYEDFERLNTQRDTVMSDMKQIESDLHHVFSQIDKPLRKYERVAAEDISLVSDYNSDPVSALLKDDEFRIMKILASMKSALEKGSIEMKESDKNKAIQRVSSLNQEFFKNFVFRYEDLKKSKKKIDDQIKNNGLLTKLDDFAYKIRHAEEQISRAEETMADLQEKMQKLGIEHLQQELEHELRLIVQLEVKIDLDNGGGVR